jgi:hypothetical protein
MERELLGHSVTISTVGEKAQAFVPAPLPPQPPIDWTPELRNKFDQALLALGRLDSVSAFQSSVAAIGLEIGKQADEPGTGTRRTDGTPHWCDWPNDTQSIPCGHGAR